MKSSTRRFCQIVLTLLLVSTLPNCSREARAKRKLDSAKERVEKGDFAGAEIEYKNALDIEPGNPKALRGLGLIWIRQGSNFDGARMLMGAREKYPADDEIGIALARGLVSLGFAEDSRKALFQVLDRSPANGDALMLLADTSFGPDAIAECEARIDAAKANDSPKVMLAAALLDLRQGLIESGTATVKRVLEKSPDEPRALGLMATILRSRKQPDAALEPASKAAELAGPRSPEIGNYARLLMELKRRDEAVAVLEKAAKAAPDYLPNWRILGLIEFSEGKDKEATEYLAKVLAKSPLDMESGLLQSQIWMRGGETAKAVGILEKLSQNFPSRLGIDFQLAKAYLAAGDTNRSMEALDRVLAAVPGATEAALLRVRLYLKEGRAGEAISTLEPIVTAQPQNRAAQDLLVGAYSIADRPNDAMALLNQQAAVAGDDPTPQIKLGMLLLGEKKEAEARQAFEKALAIAPDNFDATGQLAAMDEREGKSEQATKRVDDYLAKHADSAEAHLLKARLEISHGNAKAAEALAEKAAELAPENRDACLLLVAILTESGRNDEAIARLRKFLETKPAGAIPLRMELGTLLVGLNRDEEARDCFEELVKLHPDAAAAHNNLAYLYSERLVDLEKAVANAKKARTLDPRNPAVADTLGWIEWLRGNYTEALTLLNEAAAGMPGAPSTQYHLAMAHYKLGHIADARTALETALASKTDFPEKSAATERLKSLDSGAEDLPALEKRAAEATGDPTVQIQLAMAYQKAGRFDDAISAYDKALASNPDLEAAQLGKFEIYAHQLKDPEKAQEAAQLARRAAPTSKKSAAALGVANYLNGNYDAAYGLLKDTAEDSGDSVLLADFARTNYALGRVGEARAAMRKAIDAGLENPESARDFLTLTAPDAAGDAPALDLAKKTLAADPASVPALMLLATAPGADAEANYRKALQTYPRFDPARKDLALLLLDDPSKSAETETLATDARRSMTDDPDLTGILAILNFRKGEFASALQLFKELGTHRALNGRELLALGTSQARTNAAADAKDSLEKALKTDLSAADAAKAKEELAKLAEPGSDGK